SLNYTFRMHDARVGRFFAVDPLEKEYPFYSTYAFSGNRVLDAKEIEGKEPGFEFGLWLTGQIIKAKLSLTNSMQRIVAPVTQNNETINNNILISEKRKHELYQIDAISSSVDLSGKLLATAVVANTVVFGGGALAAETGVLSAAGTAISTELGYMASSGPAWAGYFSSQFTYQGILESSKYNMVVNSSTNLFGQIAANDFKFDKDINIIQPLFAGLTKCTFSNLGESSFKLDYNFNFSGNSFSEFTGTYISNSFGYKMSESFQGITKPIINFSGSTKSIFDIYGGSAIEVIENGIGDEISEKLNEQFSLKKEPKQ
ncbi:MAG: hypothetical protein WD512_03460, partial [Candidatus Paceibacterota bacterium]